MTPAAPPLRARPGSGPGGQPAGGGAPGRRTDLSPLLPVVLTLVVAAIAFSLLFAWLFPSPGPAQALPAARFTDITAASGIRFVQHHGAQESPTTLGGGVVVFDYDGDGRPDLLFVNGAPWPWEEDLAKHISQSSLVLYHNDGGGRFTDVTASAGLNVELQGMTAAAGDYDNDGRPDLFVTCIGPNHLFHNLGHGQFEDVTESAGVGGDEHTWSTGATWIDIDNDGRLDLVVAHYARWPEEVPLAMAFSIADLGRSYGAPAGFIAALPSVYRNLGHGRFVPVPGAAGLRTIDPATGLPAAKALAVTPLDANGDGRLDLLFTYHTAENTLFLNQGDGTFRKWMPPANARNEGASAGLASASLLVLAETPDADERLSAWQAAAPGRRDGFLQLRGKLGGALLDYEFNGHLALFTGNGRAEPDTNKFEGGRDFAAEPQLLLRRSGWLPAPAIGNWNQPAATRGIAAVDLDGDGDDDVVMVRYGGPAIVLRNDQHSGLPWLRVRLVATRSQPEAGGARVEVHTPRRIQVQTVAPAMGFMAQSDSVLTFGLGEDARVRKIVIRWPSGQRQELRPDGLNRTLVIREP
ncbi:MAG TPA: CRTAC1 family protein [Lacunisphaera sp.]|nr:CRTAC1 family protein [Lacunisphaera sp.]